MADLMISGLDHSLTSFGIAVSRGPGTVPRLIRVRPRSKGHDRLEVLRAEVRQACAGSDLAVIEGLAYEAVSATLFDRAGLFWLIRHELWIMGIPYAVIPPKTRAKWITGDGSAGKDDCLAAAIKRFGPLFPGYDDPEADTPLAGNDVADALTLAAMGCDYYGQPLAVMPADRAALLVATKLVKVRGKPSVRAPVIDWPALRRAA